MAIVINGSGTVTGISVGGLPDDIIDAGTLADNAVGLAQMAGGTDGNIITYDTSGNPAVVATGSSGQVLTSAGAGAAPTMAAAAGGGKILQVVSTTVTDTPSITTSSGWVDWSGLSVVITPSATSSKVLVTASVNISTNADSAQRLVRMISTSTPICIGDQVGSNRNRSTTGGNIHRGDHEMMQYSVNYLDSPNTTSATTYKMQGTDNNSDTFYLNRESADSDQADDSIGASTITVMEIGA